MSCRKAFALDLASFLDDPTGAAWADFRDHYPRCIECAAEVRAWTELQLALARDAHPDPDDLVRYVDDPARFAPRARHAIAEHLAACAACRDEAHTLRTFDPLVAPAAARTPVVERPSPLRALGRLVWHPAFAYGVALLVGLYPLLSGRIATQPAKIGLSEKRATDELPAIAQSVPQAREEEAKKQDGLGAGGPTGNEAPQHRALAKRSFDEEAPSEGSSEPLRADDERERLRDEGEQRYLADGESMARRKAAPPLAAGRIASSERATPAAPAPPPAEKEAAARADVQEKDAPAGSRAVAAAAKTRQAVAPITVASSGETTLRIPAGATEVALRFEPLPAGADTIRMAATDPHRLLGERPLDGPIARVPAHWLAPGRYVVMLYAGDRIAATARLDVTTP